jgi:hypothetical protein
MAAKLKIEKKGDEILKKSSPLKLPRQSQPNFAEMTLPKLCLAFQTSKNMSDQDGPHSRT